MGRKKRRTPLKEQQLPVNAERLTAHRKRRQKLVITWTIIVLALALAAVLAYSVWPRPLPYAGFAACLTQKGAVMYGTDWCSHCQAQKQMFGTAFKSVTFVNCDYTRACQDKNISGYPTWILADGTRLEGDQPLGLLGEKTGCVLSQQ